MDPKQKLIAVSVGAVCGLIIVALAVLLVMQIGAMNAAREARDSLEASINSHYAEKPYPSKANREIRKQDAEAYTAWADRAHLAFTHGLQVPQGESSSQFVSRIGEVVRKLNERQAPTTVATNAQQPQAMDYSFGRYVVQGVIPKDADVPRLAEQFAAIEYVCTLLFDNGARTITAVTREQFDAAAQPEQEETSSRRRSRRRRTDEDETPAAAAGAAISPILAKDGIRRESYAITFTAPYTAVAKTLNELTSGQLFVAITDLSMRAPVSVSARVDELVKKRQAVKSNAARRAAASRSATEQQKQQAAADKPLFEGASPAERLVSDPAHAMPLEVTLRFDIYSAPAAAPAPVTDKKEGN